jgi:FtsZ-binding cell division protein ZapB
VSQHRKPTRTELENQLARYSSIIESNSELIRTFGLRMRELKLKNDDLIEQVRAMHAELEKLRAENKRLSALECKCWGEPPTPEPVEVFINGVDQTAWSERKAGA